MSNHKIEKYGKFGWDENMFCMFVQVLGTGRDKKIKTYFGFAQHKIHDFQNTVLELSLKNAQKK